VRLQYHGDSSDGFVALDKAKTLACAGLDAYYETRLIDRLSYIQPDKWQGKQKEVWDEVKYCSDKWRINKHTI